MDKDSLVTKYPQLYHMAEYESWPSIKTLGLLSTAAILDRYGVEGIDRDLLEASHRPQKVQLSDPDLGDAVLRDQKPMKEKALQSILDDISIPDWYRLLNRKVFLWTTPTRLMKMLCGRAYKNDCHDVYTVDAERLVADYESVISLSPINSGATIFKPVRRGPSTFKPLDQYQDKEAAELTVDYGIPDFSKYVIRAEKWCKGKLVSNLD